MQSEKVRTGRGFFAALDQSGGSTPKALAEYGIERDRYSSDAEMFDLVHAMRTRVLTSPAFDGSRILAAILFEQTMEREVNGVPTARYLWDEKNVVPFLKVDKGLAAEQDGVQLMKPIDTLDDLLERAQRHQIFGTKMRSVINDAAEAGITAIVDQQFDYAGRIMAAGLVPIIEPEVSIHSPHKEQAEMLLHDAIAKHVQGLPGDAAVMLKLTIPTQVGLYGDLASDPRVLRVVALSGGYSRDEACDLLARDPTLIASFSRALLEGLTESQTDEQFNARLDSSVEQIYRASVDKEQPASPAMLRQPGLDLLGDGLGRLIPVHLDQDAPIPVVGDERAGHLGEHLQPVLDHLGRVVGPGPGEQPLDQHRVRHVQVDGGVQGQVEPPSEVGGRDRLRNGPGEPVQDVPAARGRGGNHRGEQLEDDLVRHQVAALLEGGDLQAGRGARTHLGTQHVPGRDVPHAELRGQPVALRALAAAWRGDHQQLHPPIVPATRAAVHGPRYQVWPPMLFAQVRWPCPDRPARQRILGPADVSAAISPPVR